jgi:hypothetical protein
MGAPTQPPPHIRELMDAQLRDNPRRVVGVTDYLVVPSDVDSPRTPAGVDGPVDLCEGVRIERVDTALAERLFDASALRGEDWHPTRQFYAVHAYARDVWSEDMGNSVQELSHWDHERRLWPVVQLSRLIRDNSVSTEHAVRRLIRADGTERLIPFDGFDSHAVYRLYPDRPGWLDAGEAGELRALCAAYWSPSPLPLRVRRALRRVDSITTARYLEDAMPLVVAAFESLVKTIRDFARAQFCQRVPALAAEVGVELSGEECGEVYDDRSALVHGGEVDLSHVHDLDEFGRRFNVLQETLRRVVRRAIEDREFAGNFKRDVLITGRWPTAVTVRGRATSI